MSVGLGLMAAQIRSMLVHMVLVKVVDRDKSAPLLPPEASCRPTFCAVLRLRISTLCSGGLKRVRVLRASAGDRGLHMMSSPFFALSSTFQATVLACFCGCNAGVRLCFSLSLDDVGLPFRALVGMEGRELSLLRLPGSSLLGATRCSGCVRFLPTFVTSFMRLSCCRRPLLLTPYSLRFTFLLVDRSLRLPLSSFLFESLVVSVFLLTMASL